MIEKKVLKEEQGKFTIGSKINAGQDTVKKLLQNLINSSYDLDAFETEQNWLSIQYEPVNGKILSVEDLCDNFKTAECTNQFL